VEEAVLLFHQRSNLLVGWLIQRDRDQVVQINLGRESARQLAARATNEASSSASPVAARELYWQVLDPFVQSRRGRLKVTIVPDAPFYRVPWSYVLQTSNGQAAWTIAVAPSPVLVHHTRPRQHAGIRKAFVFGAPIASPGFSALPNALREITAVGQIYADRDTRTGVEATRQAFVELASEADVVHVAAHGVDNPMYPTLSRLVLSPDSEQRIDLTVEEIRRDVKFNRRPLVVLAACSTLGSASLKGEGSIGLAWAFLMSGAQGVVATLWEIDDAESAAMFVDLHRALSKGVEPSAAVHETQESARRRGAPASVWAAIQLVGRA
jgi:CHAT domain-containing protein